MRQTARVALQYLTALKREGLQRHMSDMAQDPTRLFLVPARWRSAFLTEAALSDQAEIIVALPPYWMVAGQDLILTDGAAEQAVKVSSVSGGTITLSEDLTAPLPQGARVMMAYQARTTSQSSFRALTPSLWTGNVRYEVDPGSTPQAYPEVVLPTFEGRELFLTRPNWASGPRLDFNAPFESVDSGRGVIEVSTPELDHTQIKKMGYNGMDAEKTDALVSFFLRHKGQRTGFFMPSWQRDVTAKEPAISSSSTLLIEGPDFKNAYEGSKVYNVLIAFFPDGSYQVNRIVGYELVGLDSSLLMENGWDQEVSDDTKISFCHHWRFSTDLLSVNWITSEVSEIEIAVQTVQSGEND